MTTIHMPEEKPRELPPAGSHKAVCYLVAEMGTQKTTFGNKPMIMIGWELPEEFRSDGKPHTINRRYTMSSDRKASLRNDVEGWLGRVLTGSDFGRLNLADLRGATCQLGIKHEANGERTYANVTSVMKAAKGTPARLSPFNPATAFSLSERPFDRASFEALPSWLQELITQSPEYIAATKPASTASVAKRLRAVLAAPDKKDIDAGGMADADLDDEIPFR